MHATSTGTRHGEATNSTAFVWDGMRLVQEQSGASASAYVYEEDGYTPLARIDTDRDAKSTAFYYFHCNATGMPEELTDAEGNVLWRARYATWGKVVFENTTLHAPKGFAQNLRMQGQYHDREADLYYNTFRYYDYDTGRFTTQDPIGLAGGENLYQYAPNPLAWIDPWGWMRFRDTKGTAALFGVSKDFFHRVLKGQICADHLDEIAKHLPGVDNPDIGNSGQKLAFRDPDDHKRAYTSESDHTVGEYKDRAQNDSRSQRSDRDKNHRRSNGRRK